MLKLDTITITIQKKEKKYSAQSLENGRKASGQVKTRISYSITTLPSAVTDLFFFWINKVKWASHFCTSCTEFMLISNFQHSNLLINLKSAYQEQNQQSVRHISCYFVWLVLKITTHKNTRGKKKRKEKNRKKHTFNSKCSRGKETGGAGFLDREESCWVFASRDVVVV